MMRSPVSMSKSTKHQFYHLTSRSVRQPKPTRRLIIKLAQIPKYQLSFASDTYRRGFSWVLPEYMRVLYQRFRQEYSQLGV